MNSRYYSPEFGRFISADTPAVTTLSPDSANYDKNLFAYCDNNPVMRKDDGGQCWVLAGLVGGLISGGMSALTMAMSGEPIDWGIVAIDAAFGAVNGVLTFFGVHPAAGAIVDGLNSYCIQKYEVAKGKRDHVDSLQIAGHVLCGLVCNEVADSASNYAMKSSREAASNAASQSSRYAAKAAERRAAGQSFSYYSKRALLYANKKETFSNIAGMGTSIIHSFATSLSIV